MRHQKCIHKTRWSGFRLLAGDDEYRMRADAGLCADRYRGMEDFHAIRVAQDGYRKFRPKDAAMLHYASVAWLRERMSEPFDGPTVVIVHHAPSIRSVPRGGMEDRRILAYASHLDRLVEEGKPDLVIHGHLHSSADYKIGCSRVIANPLGYWPNHLNPDFRPDLVIEQ